MIKEEVYKNIRFLHLDGDGEAKDVLSVLAEYAVNNELVKSGYEQALLKREELFPTGIKAKRGIAIPHADQEYTRKETIIVAVLDKPCVFRAMGGGNDVPVEVLFLLILNNKQQTMALSQIVSFIQDEGKMSSLHSKNAIKEIYDSFGKYL